MANREDWGLRLFFVGIGLGLVLMLFVTGFENSSFYVTNIAPPPTTEAMRPLGYVLDAALVLAFALTVAGIACFSFGPSPAGTAAPAKTGSERGRPAETPDKDDRHRPKPRQPPAPHGST